MIPLMNYLPIAPSYTVWAIQGAIQGNEFSQRLGAGLDHTPPRVLQFLITY